MCILLPRGLVAAFMIVWCAPALAFFESGFEDGEGPVSRPGLGTNLESVVDFAAAYPFADFFKQSRPWITASQTVFDTDDADQLDLDADGWVQSLPACTANPNQFCIARTVFNSAGSPWPDGLYTVVYDGNGTITYGLNAQKVEAQSQPGRDVVDVDGNGIWILDVTATAAAPNHIRNIRVFPPGINPDSPPMFHPDFTARLTPYRAVRFMDWMNTNGGGFIGPPNDQENFGDRALVSDAHWSRFAGVPLEVMVGLANEAQLEPWFTLPHRATDDYITQFATIVRNQLDPDLVVYVEHSNEVWNNFPQGNEIQDRGTALFGNVATPFERRLNAHGLRTAQICDLFRAVFGAQSDRIVCSLGAQAANAFTFTEAADCPLAQNAALHTGPCMTSGDVVAIAPYFGNYTNVENNEDEIVNWSLSQLFDEINLGAQLQQAFPNSNTPCTDNFPQNFTVPCPIAALDEIEIWLNANRTAAQTRGMRMLAYEGGQHLALVSPFSGDPTAQARKTTISNLFVAANRDARMRDVYVDYLQRWKDLGGELFMHFSLSFSYGPFGNWGVLESLTQQPDPPKLLGILDFNAANPCWWEGCGSGITPPPPTCPQPLLDPSLEGSAWTSTSQRFGTALCTTSTCDDSADPTTVGPRTGTGWAWLGGTIDGQHAEVATLSQTVTIPNDGPRHLNFFLRRGFTSVPLDAVMEVRVDGATRRSFDEPATAEPAYLARTVDLSDIADGNAHSIEFRYTNLATSGKSSFNLDDITIDCTAVGN
ncbi:MAG: hypothetical protein KDJ14_13695 [Xanthomonadales bacterium]|nr:hypothetical protein [Xanthomonadales bacterium]